MPYVLVVDDDEDIREGLAFLLADEGYRVKTAVHGANALDVLSTNGHPCLILLDMMMPVMDGAELLNHLRSDPDTARIAVVVVSAAANLTLPESVMILRKPIRFELVLKEVARACTPGGGAVLRS